MLLGRVSLCMKITLLSKELSRLGHLSVHTQMHLSHVVLRLRIAAHVCNRCYLSNSFHRTHYISDYVKSFQLTQYSCKVPVDSVLAIFSSWQGALELQARLLLRLLESHCFSALSMGRQQPKT